MAARRPAAALFCSAVLVLAAVAAPQAVMAAAGLPDLHAKRDLIGYSEKVRDLVPRRGMKVLSWDPRIILYEGLLSDEECNHLVSKAEPRLTRSGVVDTDDPSNEGISDIRTSYGMFFDREEDEVIAAVEQRLSEWSLIPLGHGEGIQVLRYANGQEYKPHMDYFFDEFSVSNGGNRLATILMYLSTPEEGGETVFPNVKVPPSQTRQAGYSECAMDGLSVKPRKGDAVLFFSLRTEGVLDKGSLHGSCPTTKGTKYAATKWYHVAHYSMHGEPVVKVQHVSFIPPPPPAPPGCKDEKSACSGWAEGGECEHNPAFMVGTKDSPGACLLSCGRCDLMRPAALTSNRKVAGVAR